MANFLKEIDHNAEEIAQMYAEKKNITPKIADITIDFYQEEEKNKKFYKNDSFEMAYHEPVTSKLEFFLARILYHISSIKKLNWKIYLRTQKKKCAPDIRVEKDEETIFIIEVKANAGWMQAFISPEAYKRDKKKDRQPDELVKKQKEQLYKYKDAFETNNVYMFLPTLGSAHQKGYKTNYEGYKNNFKKNTGFPQDNLIILSSDLSLNLGKKNIEKSDIDKKKLTDEFEKMLHKFIK